MNQCCKIFLLWEFECRTQCPTVWLKITVNLKLKNEVVFETRNFCFEHFVFAKIPQRIPMLVNCNMAHNVTEKCNCPVCVSDSRKVSKRPSILIKDFIKFDHDR